jgi:hexosaminidase
VYDVRLRGSLEREVMMRLSRSTLVCSFAVLGTAFWPQPAPAQAAPAASAAHDLMPSPEWLEWQSGRLVVNDGFTIGLVGVADPRLEAAAQRTLARLQALTGSRLRPRPVRGRNATLVLDAVAAGLPVQAVGEDESYELTVTSRRARIIAPNALGVLRGVETFLQLVREEGRRRVVPAVKIHDRPRFRWRGLLLDPCRRWQPIEVVKRTIDGLAAVKMNVLHWHLSEDQGFRIESKVFPKLHGEGGDGLFYTQEQVRDVVAYARERGVRVVPEFDMPGHSTSWLVGYPELGSAPGPFTLARTWGIFDNNLDPSRDEVYTFVDRFLGEMAGLFPDAHLHIGGDEVTPRQWNQNAAILDFMYRNHLDGPAGLQAHFNLKVNEILTRHGKRMVGWDEILRPELPKSIVVQSWRGAESLAHGARRGYDGILSSGYYLDHMYPASVHYLNDPVPADSSLSGAERKHVLGGEACMWGEFVSAEVVDSRVWPRTAAIAERLWSPPTVRDVADMYRRLEVQSVRLEALGLSHRSGYEPMLADLAGGQPTGPLRVLADLVEPVKLYMRGELRSYTQSTPLDRLVDAARPESAAARTFRADVDRLLLSAAGARDDKIVRAVLQAWRDNHPVLEPILTASAKAAEARPLSRDLADLGGVGLEALDALASGQQPEEKWGQDAQQRVRRAYVPRAEVQLAVVPSVLKLVLAASQLEESKTVSPEEWTRKLDEQVTKATKPSEGS